MIKSIVFFFLLSKTLFAEPLNVETLPYLRTKQYSKKPYDKIVVFSSPRTGSSLVYNVFRFLFEEKGCLSFPHNEFRLDRSILKTHIISNIKTLKQTKENILYVITTRDPLQASISTCRIRPRPVKNMQVFCKNLIDRQIKHLNFIEQLKDSGCSVKILRYEEFEKNPCRYLVDFIETNFQLSVSERDEETLQAGLARENIYYNIQLLPDFNKCLPISGFHGKHVALEPFIPPQDFLYWINHYLDEAKPLFRKHGYFN